jgi:hypothetical protein
MPDLEARLAALEAAVTELRDLRGSAPLVADEGDQFWLLQEVRRRSPAGAVVFGGTATVGKGELAWQWGLESDRLLEQEWQPAAVPLDALSHPVRLKLLQRVLNGVTTTAELGEDPTLGTTGQLHHHLRALVAGGWLHSTGRGQWAVPPQRVIPLLVVVAATTS